jgi:hypothetical protein
MGLLCMTIRSHASFWQGTQYFDADADDVIAS